MTDDIPLFERDPESDQKILALCNLSGEALSCELAELECPAEWRDLIIEKTLPGSGPIPLHAWQIRWLT